MKNPLKKAKKTAKFEAERVNGERETFKTEAELADYLSRHPDARPV